MFFCCCAKNREDKEDELNSINSIEAKLKNWNRILLQFVREEQMLGLKSVPCLDIFEKVLVASNKGEVPKK